MALDDEEIRRLLNDSQHERSEASARACGQQVAAFLAGIRSGSVVLSEEHATDLARDYLGNLFDMYTAIEVERLRLGSGDKS